MQLRHKRDSSDARSSVCAGVSLTNRACEARKERTGTARSRTYTDRGKCATSVEEAALNFCQRHASFLGHAATVVFWAPYLLLAESHLSILN